MWKQRRWIPVVVTGLMMVSSAAARAAESREAREREARKACFTGNVDRGVEILVDLYGETGHPNYIYNQARCFERNGKYEQALLSYEDYLRKAKDLGDPERAQVEKSIAELRAKVASAPDLRGWPGRGTRAAVPGPGCAGPGAKHEPGGGRADTVWKRRQGGARRGLALAAEDGRRLAGRRGWGPGGGHRRNRVAPRPGR